MRGAKSTIALATMLALSMAVPLRSSGQICSGDCNQNGTVTVDEIVLLVNAALGVASVSVCTRGDASSDDEITIDEIVSAVNAALRGCAGPTLTATLTPPLPTPAAPPTLAPLVASEVTFFTNPGDGQLANISTTNGLTVEYYGERDEEGIPSQPTHVRLTGPDLGEHGAVVALDAAGRPSSVVIENLDVSAKLDWRADGLLQLTIIHGELIFSALLPIDSEGTPEPGVQDSPQRFAARLQQLPARIPGEVDISTCGETELPGEPSNITVEGHWRDISHSGLESHAFFPSYRSGIEWSYSIPRPADAVDITRVCQKLHATLGCAVANVGALAMMACFAELAGVPEVALPLCTALGIAINAACRLMVDTIATVPCERQTRAINRYIDNEANVWVTAYGNYWNKRLFASSLTDQPVTVSNNSSQVPPISLDFDYAGLAQILANGWSPTARATARSVENCGSHKYEVTIDPPTCQPWQRVCIECYATRRTADFLVYYDRQCADGAIPSCYAGYTDTDWRVGVGETWDVDVRLLGEKEDVLASSSVVVANASPAPPQNYRALRRLIRTDGGCDPEYYGVTVAPICQSDGEVCLECSAVDSGFGWPPLPAVTDRVCGTADNPPICFASTGLKVAFWLEATIASAQTVQTRLFDSSASLIDESHLFFTHSRIEECLP
jgi:hypothetical protein